VVVARFIPWVRTFTPILAGIAEMSPQRFVSANVVGFNAWFITAGAALLTACGLELREEFAGYDRAPYVQGQSKVRLVVAATA